MNFMVKELAEVYAKGYRAGAQAGFKVCKNASRRLHRWLLEQAEKPHADDIAAKFDELVLEEAEHSGDV